ncbi:DegT/DnrJ/EryC1/StrS family aminotransferase [Marinactinospora rubrisoli]|uniref:DegT/DnrJ/EryC1/StrS family aminotransferase n=1 Tax=Marinactinospora rubrisoli TaxID=2715399 RepID=A0ABW2KFB2_9ACTN
MTAADEPAGEPVWKVTLADSTIDVEEIAAVTEVLRSRWLTAGRVTRDFEREFAAAHGAPDAVAVSSGTAALHLAALALGIGPGDEVIVPSLSFVASAAVTALSGATPVFADVVAPDDLTIDPAEVRRLITPRTRAVVAMHYAGHPARLGELAEAAREHGVTLIEDAAHAPLVRSGEDGGGMLGTVGDIGCFSFYSSKNMTTGEGGMLVARDPALLERMRSLRSHALSTSTWDRTRGGVAGYDVDGAGLNYRPTEISSALGRVQLGRLPTDRARRRRLVADYRAALAAEPRIGVPFAERTGDSAHHLMAVLLPPGVPRDEVRAHLRSAGVQTSVHYPPTHRFSHYRRAFASDRRPLPVTDEVTPRLLSLPLHSRMTGAEAVLAADALIAAVRRSGEGRP